MAGSIPKTGAGRVPRVAGSAATTGTTATTVDSWDSREVPGPFGGNTWSTECRESSWDRGLPATLSRYSQFASISSVPVVSVVPAVSVVPVVSPRTPSGSPRTPTPCHTSPSSSIPPAHAPRRTFHRVINNFQHLPLTMLCDSRKLGWPIYPFKIRHCACLLEKREKDIKKVRWIIYHLSTIEDCTFTSLGRLQFSKIQHEFLKERIEGEGNARVTAFLKESCRQVSETCHNIGHRMVAMRNFRHAAAQERGPPQRGVTAARGLGASCRTRR